VKLDRKRLKYTLVLASDGLWTVFGPNVVLKNLNSLMNGVLGKPKISNNQGSFLSGGDSEDSPEQMIIDGKR
jgi:hypothetical protein